MQQNMYPTPLCSVANLTQCLWPKVYTNIQCNTSSTLTSLRFLASGQLFLTITKSEQESLCKHGEVHHHKQYMLCANNTRDRAKFMFIIFVIFERALCLLVLRVEQELYRIDLLYRTAPELLKSIDIGSGLSARTFGAITTGKH